MSDTMSDTMTTFISSDGVYFQMPLEEVHRLMYDQLDENGEYQCYVNFADEVFVFFEGIWYGIESDILEVYKKNC